MAEWITKETGIGSLFVAARLETFVIVTDIANRHYSVTPVVRH